MVAGRGVDELCADANLVARLANAALHNVLDAELAPDAFYVDGRLSVLECRVAGNSAPWRSLSNGC